MAKLQLAGEKLGKMETAKKQAIQQEDYSKAKKKKLQIEEFKTQIYSNLSINDLLEKNGVGIVNRILDDFYIFFHGFCLRNCGTYFLKTVTSNDAELDPDDESINRILFKDENDTYLNADSEVDSKVRKASSSATNFPVETVLPNYGHDSLLGAYESPVSPLHVGSNAVGSFRQVDTGYFDFFFFRKKINFLVHQ